MIFIVHTMPRRWVYLKMGLPDAYDGQALAREQIDHCEHAQLAAIKQVVRHKVHAPYLVHPAGLFVRLAQLSRLVVPGSLVPQ